jgi:hypothetical protein
VVELRVFDSVEVHAIPETALNLTLYGVPAFNPVISMGLDVPLAFKNVLLESTQYWYFVSAGLPPDESMNTTLRLASEPSIGETEVMDGAVPFLYVVAETGSEIGEAHAVLFTARNTTVCKVPAFNPVIVNGFVVKPETSVNKTPSFREYWYLDSDG